MFEALPSFLLTTCLVFLVGTDVGFALYRRFIPDNSAPQVSAFPAAEFHGALSAFCFGKLTWHSLISLHQMLLLPSRAESFRSSCCWPLGLYDLPAAFLLSLFPLWHLTQG